MKILLVNKFLYVKGGSETYLFTLANALKKAGHEVIFFGMKDKRNIETKQEKYFVDNVEYNGKINIFKQIKLAKKIIYSKEAKRKMTKLIEDEKPDLAIFNLVHRQLSLSIIEPLKKNKIPIFWVTHDLIFACPNYTMLDNNGDICEKCMNNNFKYCAKKRCIKGSFFKSYLAYKEAQFIKKHNYYNDVDLYICPSKFYKNKLTEANFTTSPIIHIPNPLEMDRNIKMPTLDEIKDYVLYFGRISKEKGIRTLIDAVIDIPGKKLNILGTGPLEKELEEYVISKKVDNRIKFLGFKSGDELRKYIREAKVVVLPSEWYENGPYSAMESMYLGKILIVSDNNGLQEMVENKTNGYVVSQNNKNELIQVINLVYYISNNDYIRMCKYSYLFSKGYFDCSKYIGKIIYYFNQT